MDKLVSYVLIFGFSLVSEIYDKFKANNIAEENERSCR